MKTINALLMVVFSKIHVDQKSFLIVLIMLFIFTPILALVWVLIYGTMVYGHMVYLAVENRNHHQRFSPIAETDLAFRKAVTPYAIKLAGLWVGICTLNLWLLPITQLLGNMYKVGDAGYDYVNVY